MRRRTFRPEWPDAEFERREMLSGAGLPPAPALLAQDRAPVHHSLFHHDGINGRVLHRTFVNRLNDRLAISQDQATRVVQAFQVFATDYAPLPLVPPAGSTGPTLPDLVSRLKSEVDYALGTHIVISSRPTPSASRAPTVSPLAPKALIPFANAQIDALGSTLATAPPVVGPHGSLTRPDPTPALNTAINAILNALAETSVHPNLFQSPSDFYLSPDFTFDINFSGIPAKSSPGYFVRGPHGVTLPGAPLHPHLAV